MILVPFVLACALYCCRSTWFEARASKAIRCLYYVQSGLLLLVLYLELAHNIRLYVAAKK
jgi:predicted Na+-dependent transporter